MTSPLENRGRALLHSWKSRSALVTVSSASIEAKIVVRGSGQIVDLKEDFLRLTGQAGFEVWVNLRRAAFEVVEATEVLRAGTDPAGYGESVKISVGTGDEISFSALPEPDKGKPN